MSLLETIMKDNADSEQRRMQSQPIKQEDTFLGMGHKIFFTKPKDDDLDRLFKQNGKHKNLL
jgi:hypothetical protein